MTGHSTNRHPMRRGISLAAAFAAAAASLLIAGAARAGEAAAADCAGPPALTMIEPALSHAAARIERGQELTIVAVGSSSTEGVGASTPAASYPSRLEADLRERVPGVEIRVVNRGKGGEDAAEELTRLDRDVIAEHPELVLWQVGTNAVLRRDDLAADGELIRRGVGMLKESGADVVLMDLQYAPRVLQRPSYAAMEELIADAAAQAHAGLFRRFALMRYWQSEKRAVDDAMTPMIGPDGLHMTDAGYGCLAAELAEALARNWWSQQRSARRLHRTVGEMAGLHRPIAATAPEAPNAR